MIYATIVFPYVLSFHAIQSSIASAVVYYVGGFIYAFSKSPSLEPVKKNDLETSPANNEQQPKKINWVSSCSSIYVSMSTIENNLSKIK